MALPTIVGSYQGEPSSSSLHALGQDITVLSPAICRIYFLDVGIGDNLTDLNKFTENGRVLCLKPNETTVSTLVSGLSLPDCVVISMSTRRIFWTNMGSMSSACDGSIMSAKLDGSDIQTVIHGRMIHSPKQLTVDEKSQKLYFCDREGMCIHRCNLDGQSQEVIVHRANLQRSSLEDATCWCVGLAVDPEAKTIYWTQKGPSKAGKGRIFRANLDRLPGSPLEGRSEIKTLLEDLPEPIYLELDTTEHILYWTDRGEHPTGCSLNRMYVGEKSDHPYTKPKILARHLNEPIGLKLDVPRQKIYVTDLGGSVYRFNADGTGKEIILRGKGSYTGIALFTTND